jgi:chromate transporter
MVKTWLNLLLAFTRVGLLGYGGGPSMIPLVQREVVDVFAWMNEADFVDLLAMGNALPGPIATKMAWYVGYQVAGVVGALAALLGTIWPSTVLMMVVGLFFARFKDSRYSKAMLTAVRPVVVGLLVWTTYDIFRPSVKNWHTGLIAVVSFALITFLNVHPALVILGAAVLGLIVYR